MASIESIFLGFLSMDVYSRGYNPGLSDGIDNHPDDDRGEDGLGENSNEMQTVGSTKIFWTIDDALLYDEGEGIGFHAIAYRLTEAVGSLAKGAVVVSYRGTDGLGHDVPYGYGLGAGSVSSQAKMASDFFRSVRS